MPELPEVETIRRGLESFIKNAKIKTVEIFCDKSFLGPKELVENQKIINLRRKGKALLIDLENGITLLIHLRMTGQLIFRGKNVKTLDLIESGHLKQSDSFAGGHPSENFVDNLPNKQTRVAFTLENGKLFFNDQRKFGFIKVLETTEVENDPFIKKLAPEPWDMNVVNFTTNLMRHKSQPIKATILDQKVIAGIGNIYADEALFYAKIHPKRQTGSLTDTEIEKLLEGAKTVMQSSIDSGGSTMQTYVKADGTKGDYLRLFAKVFRREGEPCVNCGTEIIKIRVAGRGTHICPKCQKEKN
ncbi:bifunctional DNA-formamidopyrimidine glycosylase/DNA-(apurinic or apyrimidinic site) lyase [Candidatus Saccharibacteria bacterium]|nr:bifunctional DNA-formamidopyrimidine glycosylase/DNA-(apurinic or apyrimidinic site) lyase [Candidatus Saccharibacteria bacterium]